VAAVVQQVVDFYAYNVGSLVQFAPNGRIYEVVWRGELRVRDGTGWVRWDVYRVAGAYECYFRDELRPAGFHEGPGSGLPKNH
jgi:hypothetical protein